MSKCSDMALKPKRGRPLTAGKPRKRISARISFEAFEIVQKQPKGTRSEFISRAIIEAKRPL